MLRLNNSIFITGGSGYIGTRLIKKLVAYRYEVTALVREGSQSKIPEGCNIVIGDALDHNSYKDSIAPAQTFIHLIGVSHPGPGKTEQFNKIDKVSIEEAVAAARHAGIKHFIYLSVAQPAPIMKGYIEIRIYGENLLRESNIFSTFLRPWYVLGPGHRWPYLFLPFYKLSEFIPGLSKTAKRLALVNIKQMVGAIADAVRHPPQGIRKIEPYEIKRYGK